MFLFSLTSNQYLLLTPSISLSGDLIQSPIENGRSRNIMSAPKKFAKRSLAAKPIAMPPIPPKAKTPATEHPVTEALTELPLLQPRRAIVSPMQRSSLYLTRHQIVTVLLNQRSFNQSMKFIAKRANSQTIATFLTSERYPKSLQENPHQLFLPQT